MIIIGEEEIVVEFGEGNEVGEFFFVGIVCLFFVSFDIREGV